MLQILIIVPDLEPVVEMIKYDLAQDAPVDRRAVVRRINDMLDEILEFFPEEPVGAQFDDEIEALGMDDDELIYSMPDVYLLRQILRESRRHPHTRDIATQLRSAMAMNMHGDVILEFI
jgi:hypothetical protein